MIPKSLDVKYFVHIFKNFCGSIRTHLKIRISVQNRGGVFFQTGDILEYFEDLKQGANKDVGPKDNFEMGSKNFGPDRIAGFEVNFSGG